MIIIGFYFKVFYSLCVKIFVYFKLVFKYNDFVVVG